MRQRKGSRENDATAVAGANHGNGNWTPIFISTVLTGVDITGQD